MADFLQPFNQNLGGMSLQRKALLLMVAAGLVAGTVVLYLWTQRPDYQVLYSNLSSEDAGAIVAKLKETHVPYSFSADGAAVLVPSEQVHELRLQLASQGLPQGGGVGFEIFDRSTFGTTEFVQKLNYRRALQGELARTISQLTAVDKARVHLAMPERTLFSDQQEKPRASVVVSLLPGKLLTPGQIQGIVHLVASSVDGLTPQAVTVVDTHGQILSGTADASNSPLTRSQSEYQSALEKETESKVQTMLERVVGVGKAIVRVSAVLDLRQVELTEEKYDPESQVIRSEQRSQDKTTGSSSIASPSGVPGVLSNLPTEAQAASQEGSTNQNSSQRKNDVVNYEINKTVSRVIEPVGAIKKLSVAAMVDGTYEIVKSEDGKGTRKYAPRSDDEMKRLEDVVKKAVGYSPEREDQVVIVNIPFSTNTLVDEEMLTATEASPDLLSRWMPLARYAMGLILTLIVIAFVVRPVLRAILTPSPAALGVPALPSPSGRPELTAATMNRDQGMQLARQNPQAAASVVKKWLKEK